MTTKQTYAEICYDIFTSTDKARELLGKAEQLLREAAELRNLTSETRERINAAIDAVINVHCTLP